MQLKPSEVIIEKFKTIIIEKNYVKLKFTFMQEVEIPINAISKEKINNRLGNKIGILNFIDNWASIVRNDQDCNNSQASQMSHDYELNPRCIFEKISGRG